MRIITWSSYLLLLLCFNLSVGFAAQYTTGVTAVSQLPYEERAALFNNPDLTPSGYMPIMDMGDHYLMYKSGVFDDIFQPQWFTVLMPDGSTQSHPELMSRLIGQQFAYKARQNFGYPVNKFDLRDEHGINLIGNDILSTHLNMHYNRVQSATEWGIENVDKNLYLNPPAWLLEEEVIDHLVHDGPLWAEIVFFHMPVMIVGYTFDKYGTLSFIYQQKFGSDWGEGGYGKIPYVNLAKWQTVKRAQLVADFGPQEDAQCVDADSDGFCSWGLGSKPESCSCESVERDCHDGMASVLAADFKRTCLPGATVATGMPDYIVVDTVYSTAQQALLVTIKNIGDIDHEYKPVVQVNGFGSSLWQQVEAALPVGVPVTVSFPRSSMSVQPGQTYTADAYVDSNSIIPENSEDNNRLINSVLINDPYSDLIIDDIYQENAMVIFRYKNVGNYGNYNSMNVRLNINGYQIDRTGYVPTAGATGTVGVYLSQVSLMGVTGNYQMSATADTGNVINESIFENNNSLTKSVAISPPILPDLIVSSVVYDSGNIVFTVYNQGTAPAGSNATLRAIANNITRDYLIASPAPGQSVVHSVPQSQFSMFPGGSYNFQVWADYWSAITELDEVNNYKYQNITLPGVPDYIIYNLYMSGDYIVATVKNQGSASSSVPAFINITANGITSSAQMAFPAAGGYVSYTAHYSNFNLPQGMQFSATAMADATNLIPESSESNNSYTITLTAPGVPQVPDYIVQSIVLSGSNLVITVKNQGVTSPVVNAGISVTANGVTSVAQYAMPAAGQTVVRNVATSVFNLLSGSTYNVSASADSASLVAESNEVNNSLTSAVTMPGSGSIDLIVTSIALSGSNIIVSYKNQGTMASGNAYLDVWVGSYYSSISMAMPAAGQTLTRSYALSTFNMLAGQTYTVNAYVDSYSQIVESNENNNQSAPQSISVPAAPSGQPDLQITAINRYVYSGSTMYAMVSVKNNGGSAVAGLQFAIKLEGNGRIITKTGNTPPAAGATSTYFMVVGVYSGLWMYTSQYYCIAGTADVNSQIVESNESNNGFNKCMF